MVLESLDLVLAVSGGLWQRQVAASGFQLVPFAFSDRDALLGDSVRCTSR